MKDNPTTTPILQNETMYSVEETAKILKLSPTTIYRYLVSGELKASRVGARFIRIKGEDIQNLITPFKGGEYGVWNR